MKYKMIVVFTIFSFLVGCAGNQISEAEKRQLEREQAQAQKAEAEKSHRELDRETR
ncbi:MAG: hypothetical protein GW898_08530 [Thiomicrospira sp.]|nr:hypothetical protein [Thiomicrospira sp.]NCO80603.1 hypothetical protein [Thiomicrospira sp.]